MSLEDEVESAVGKIKNGDSKNSSIYGDLAPVYHYLYGDTYDYRGQADIVEDFAPEEVSRVCDGGCGTGGLTKILSKKFPKAEIVGVDLNEEMLKYAKKLMDDNENVRFRQENLMDIESKFDIYTIFGTTSHFSEEDLQQLFQRINQNLTSDGVLVFDYKSPDSKKHENGHISTWERDTENYEIENPIMTVYREGQPYYAFSFQFRDKETGEEFFAGEIMEITLYRSEELREMLQNAGFNQVEVKEGVLDQSGVIIARNG